ncbi:tetratricopeptide repeat protein [Desulfovibrio inopinatus]|uniref:tetratricopeptide repeat protein n=1 Tax=Desulfovibrio inopinatus TaxID=102109 RepID=UPI00041D33E1|nr:tetratricopeptide repeat protein [Desulfovibrio inopinatus]
MMNTPPFASARFYNPDWLSDEDLKAGFVARTGLFQLLLEDLRRTPVVGSVQHHVLVGVRGSGKTTMLKRLAVAIAEEEELKERLIALSYPEELYDVKSVGDFWWASCRALVDALDHLGFRDAADDLDDQIEERDRRDVKDDATDDEGFRLLKKTCAAIQRRPVLLVDNLDMIFQRIGKKGRKAAIDAPSYWELRTTLSETDAPMVIGGSLRLSGPFTSQDNAFYSFFLPHRLGKLSLDDAHNIFDHLARQCGDTTLHDRLRKQPGRIRALYELTGGNPRAIHLIFELLRQGPGSQAIDDFERLLDLTTPYYKARFEDLSDQAQVVMHALAVMQRNYHERSFGHTAADISKRAKLETRTVSAQLDILINDGVVEKETPDNSKVQYRVSEELFRLWIQMRSGSRRIRQHVVGLTEFLEALYEQEEIKAILEAELALAKSGSHRGRMLFALSAGSGLMNSDDRRFSDACAVSSYFSDQARATCRFADAFAKDDIDADVHALSQCKDQLQHHTKIWKNAHPKAQQIVNAMLGALDFSLGEKQESTSRLCDADQAQAELNRLYPLIKREKDDLVRWGMAEDEVDQIYEARSQGLLDVCRLKPDYLELKTRSELHPLVMKLVGVGRVPLSTKEEAESWFLWAQHHCREENAVSWACFANAFRKKKYFDFAQKAVSISFSKKETARGWFECGVIQEEVKSNFSQAESAYLKAIELDPTWAWPCIGLGNLLCEHLERYEEAKSAYRKAIDLDPSWAWPWNNLGNLLCDHLERYEEAESAFRKAIELDPDNVIAWGNLGLFFHNKLERYEEAELAYRNAIALDPSNAIVLCTLGNLLSDYLHRYDDAEDAFKKVIELDPENTSARIRLSELRHRNIITACAEAMDAENWDAIRTILAGRTDSGREFGEWLVGERFIEGVVGKTLQRGHGPTLLSIFQELRFERIAAPLVFALDAAIAGDRSKLERIEPEAREASLAVFDRLQNRDTIDNGSS